MGDVFRFENFKYENIKDKFHYKYDSRLKLDFGELHLEKDYLLIPNKRNTIFYAFRKDKSSKYEFKWKKATQKASRVSISSGLITFFEETRNITMELQTGKIVSESIASFLGSTGSKFLLNQEVNGLLYRITKEGNISYYSSKNFRGIRLLGWIDKKDQKKHIALFKPARSDILEGDELIAFDNLNTIYSYPKTQFSKCKLVRFNNPNYGIVQFERIPRNIRKGSILMRQGNLYLKNLKPKSLVFVDGVLCGLDNFFVHGLSLGQHKVIIYHPQLGKFEKNIIIADSSPVEVSIDNSENEIVSLTLETRTPGAKVYIDKLYFGTTPIKIDNLVRNRTVNIEFQPYSFYPELYRLNLTESNVSKVYKIPPGNKASKIRVSFNPSTQNKFFIGYEFVDSLWTSPKFVDEYGHMNFRFRGSGSSNISLFLDYNLSLWNFKKNSIDWKDDKYGGIIYHPKRFSWEFGVGYRNRKLPRSWKTVSYPDSAYTTSPSGKKILKDDAIPNNISYGNIIDSLAVYNDNIEFIGFFARNIQFPYWELEANFMYGFPTVITGRKLKADQTYGLTDSEFSYKVNITKYYDLGLKVRHTPRALIFGDKGIFIENVISYRYITTNLISNRIHKSRNSLFWISLGIGVEWIQSRVKSK